MTTNAQAALQAAATHYSNVNEAGEDLIFEAAGRFKAWLDAQDEADREAWRKDKTRPRPGRATSGVRVVPEGAGIMDGMPEVRGYFPPPYPSALDLIDGDGTAGSADRRRAATVGREAVRTSDVQAKDAPF